MNETCKDENGTDIIINTPDVNMAVLCLRTLQNSKKKAQTC